MEPEIEHKSRYECGKKRFGLSMIASLTGTVESCSETGVVLCVNGIGFEVNMSAEGIRELASCSSDELVHVHTYMSFGREGDAALFGFLTADELSLFKKLITVSGIGPKGALALLSSMSVDDLIFAILSGDAKSISRAPGIGKKTAERVVLDLRDKLELNAGTPEPGISAESGAGSMKAVSGAAEEAAEALTALGYARSEAMKAVHQAGGEEGMDSSDVQALLSGALRYLG